MMRIWIWRSSVLFFFAIQANKIAAQDGDSAKVRITADIGFGVGSHTSFKMALNSVFAKNHILGLIISLGVRDGLAVPSNYYSGSLIKVGDGIPNEKVFSMGILYGKMLYSKATTVRFSLKGGAAYCLVVVPGNFRATTNKWLGPNYFYANYNISVPALVFNPAIEFPFAKSFGMSLGILSCINKQSSTVGVELSFLFRD